MSSSVARSAARAKTSGQTILKNSSTSQTEAPSRRSARRRASPKASSWDSAAAYLKLSCKLRLRWKGVSGLSLPGDDLLRKRVRHLLRHGLAVKGSSRRGAWGLVLLLFLCH